MAHIDYYFTVLSPWAYLAGDRMEKIAAKHGATVTYKPLDIMALFPRTGGQPLGERPPARQNYRLQELARWQKATGLPLNAKPAHWPTNAAPASYAIIGAQSAGGGDVGALVRAILRASWAEDRDIAEDAVIKSCLESAGFDPAIADTSLLAGAETYPRNLEDAVEAGVFGSPTYVVDGAEVFWGQDRLDMLDSFLAGA
ncbi:2-hydroxychromene-2-carboxylate isomerase [Aliiroseovarius sp.]|uniref:2-hydroxychromene-2-carboxylate isomerase n=1 Tax=Aliiroseovarius sp. TaxID=1872442 RepID=UPI0026373B4E|nr:2-hydroxychromene-2-carboxylate isomerase [Aliiroseovarius sp.]